ncbi:HAD family phosphatase [Variovorax sp. OV329]|uniref:HAD family hydrolase n=1 Tax=Variovorax sp. OV329 TaxID=1882825 RepID=UPI0008DF24BB|nr:HAD family phosphatase [Variovorax sp. OV329]SFN31985.1 putative hydrolase of the HAD superfamily [Variovorax sp. OV329]
MSAGFDPSRVKALLFDLGGVVFEFDFAHALEYWAPMSSLPADELRAAFSHDEDYQRHERGELTGSEYFDTLRRKLRLDATDAQIEAGWNAIFRDEIGPTLDAIEAARRFMPCYAFSNTNRSHHAAWRAAYPRIEPAFDQVFASSDIGLRKPERAAFEHVCREIGLPPQSLLFFDDLAENVAGARACGLQAVQVRSPQDVRSALLALGCLR